MHTSCSCSHPGMDAAGAQFSEASVLHLHASNVDLTCASQTPQRSACPRMCASTAAGHTGALPLQAGGLHGQRPRSRPHGSRRKPQGVAEGHGRHLSPHQHLPAGAHPWTLWFRLRAPHRCHSRCIGEVLHERHVLCMRGKCCCCTARCPVPSTYTVPAMTECSCGCRWARALTATTGRASKYL